MVVTPFDNVLLYGKSGSDPSVVEVKSTEIGKDGSLKLYKNWLLVALVMIKI